MAKTGRYLHFATLDPKAETQSGECSSCGRTFLNRQNPSDRMDDVLLRIRSEFDGHNCKEHAKIVLTEREDESENSVSMRY